MLAAADFCPPRRPHLDGVAAAAFPQPLGSLSLRGFRVQGLGG